MKKIIILILGAILCLPIFGCTDHTHTMGDWEVLSNASCTRVEILQRKCLGCEYNETKQGKPAKGHTYSTQIVAPTYTQSGYTEYTCICGDNYKADYTYLISFEHITDNINLSVSLLPDNFELVYDENVVFYGFNNTSTLKIIEYRIYKADMSYDVLEIGQPFTKSTKVSVVWI